MMKAEEFAARWSGQPLTKFGLKGRLYEGMRAEEARFLREIGLPQAADPWLCFMEVVHIDGTAADVFDELHYAPIGCLPNGDLIGLDRTSGHVMIWDHEDGNETWMLNASLEALYESLLLFQDFMRKVNAKNPHYASDFKIPDGMLEQLAEDLRRCDPVSYEARGFWFTEIQALSE